MSLFSWDNEYSVGTASMDNHHKKLFNIINKLHDSAKEGKGSKVIDSIILELIDYTKFHFAEEEKLLEQINYSGLAAQKRAHREFLSKMEDYKRQVESGDGIFVVIKVTRTATDWLKLHILKLDKQYEKALKA